MEDLPEDLLKSDDFINELQAEVNVWIKHISKVTKLDRIEEMPKNSDTAQEIKFWIELESELKHIEQQLQSAEASCTLAALKLGKRFMTTAAFDTDTIGLKKAMEKGTSSNTLTKFFKCSTTSPWSETFLLMKLLLQTKSNWSINAF